jgi:hypothetical protein
MTEGERKSEKDSKGRGEGGRNGKKERERESS